MEQVLHDYIATFSGPVPEHIIAALTTLFGLHSDFTTQLDEALLELAGDGLDDLQEEVAAAGSSSQACKTELICFQHVYKL